MAYPWAQIVMPLAAWRPFENEQLSHGPTFDLGSGSFFIHVKESSIIITRTVLLVEHSPRLLDMPGEKTYQSEHAWWWFCDFKMQPYKHDEITVCQKPLKSG